jgi:putative aldouronate transport system permease protein
LANLITADRTNKTPPTVKSKTKLQILLRDIWESRLLYLLLIPGLIILVLFKWAPLFGLVISFQNYTPYKGILGSPFVGFKNFMVFLQDPYCLVLIKNTVLLALLTLVVSFPIPIIFTLFLNESNSRFVKKSVQSISFFPYFISAAVCVSILYTFLSPSGGFVNMVLNALGMPSVFFMAQPEWFRPLYIGLTVWQTFGYNSIVYLAAITNIDPGIYEAADIDGANRWRKMFNVTLPSISGMIVTMFIVNLGNILSVDINKILLMYNSSVYSTADVLQTYVYRMAFASNGLPQYSLGTAVSLFQSVIAMVLVFLANKVAKKYSDSRLF